MIRLLVLSPLWLGLVMAQCPPPAPPPPDCNGCIHLDKDDPNIPSDEVRCVPAGETMIVSDVDLGKDATLIVCGTLVVNGDLNLNNNGSKIIITPGGTLQVTSSVNINSRDSIHNYGTMHVQNNLHLNGAGSSFWNIGPLGVLTVLQDIIVNASANFINDGTNIQANSLTLNGNATVCMRNSGCFSLRNLTVNGSGSVIVGDGVAAISYTGHATLNAQLTDNSNLLRLPGARRYGREFFKLG